jgi:hypothetical protein
VRWAGDGSELWGVRVDLFAPDHDSGRVPATHEALGRRLTETDGVARRPGDWAADQGLGREGDRPVVGLVFWVAADEIGQAATLAAETARQLERAESGRALYDVVVIPHAVRIATATTIRSSRLSEVIPNRPSPLSLSRDSAQSSRSRAPSRELPSPVGRLRATPSRRHRSE